MQWMLFHVFVSGIIKHELPGKVIFRRKNNIAWLTMAKDPTNDMTCRSDGHVGHIPICHQCC